MKLKSARIKNFKSLGDVELTFRDLTILVGPNASGKSNCLEALSYLSNLLASDSLPKLERKQRLPKHNSENICFLAIVEDADNLAEYSISLASRNGKTVIANEYLKVNKTDVIEISNGEGKVSDETGGNPQNYQSDPEMIEGLALRAAGNFGTKPVTKKLANYIRDWEFYDIDPDRIRNAHELNMMFKAIKQIQDIEIVPSLGTKASEVQEVLNYWAEKQRDKFNDVRKELKDFLNISLTIDGEGQGIIKVLEGDGKEIPLASMSDGTLRLIAYLILLYESKIPPLIGIEEPERNFHPGILKDVASIMKRLSKRTQVVMTTHSSQLLDCFNQEEISSDISVILLSKKDEAGTKACLLDKLAENRDDLADWMNDFGLGSAIYHSHLIEEILGT